MLTQLPAAPSRGGRRSLLSITALALAVLPVATAQADPVFTWGSNQYGSIGNGTSSGNVLSPAPIVDGDNDYDAVTAGGAHSLALKDGALFGWGLSVYAATGYDTASTGTSVSTASPTLTSGVTDIAGGLYHSVAVVNGGAYGFGADFSGQTGTGATPGSEVSVPTLITSLGSGVTQVSAGTQHSLALQNGAVYSFGLNNRGQLGTGASTVGTNSSVPVAVSGLGSGVTEISAGADYALAVQNGDIYAWGSNDAGQVGNGTVATPVATPSLVLGIPDVGTTSSVAAGGKHGLALVDGVVYSWGDNTYGQLGDGGLVTSRSVAAAVAGILDPVVKVEAGFNHSYALTDEGNLYVWGDNRYGQLGLGTSGSSVLAPQLLMAPEGYIFADIDVGGIANHATALLTPVPEPGSMAVLALGGGLLLRRKRLA